MPLFLDILWRETEGDPKFRERAFAGLRRYQQAQRPPRPSAPHIAAEAGPARLLHFGTGEASGRKPLLLVPSLINPADVLDLSESRSLARWLTAAGHDVYLIDWGEPGAADAALDLAGHVEQRLLPLIGTLREAPVLVGYCLGGTLTLAAAATGAAAAVVALAAPWDFDGFTPDARAQVRSLWGDSRSMCERLGYVPMEVLQSGFWALDPSRTIRKYAAFADMEPGSDAERAFLTVEDWANEGAPLTFAASRELFDDLYDGNATARGEWRVAGRVVDLAALPCPSLAISSATDRIVPAASSPALAETRTLALGHVGMIVGGRAQRMLWQPLSVWLSKQGA